MAVLQCGRRSGDGCVLLVRDDGVAPGGICRCGRPHCRARVPGKGEGARHAWSVARAFAAAVVQLAAVQAAGGGGAGGVAGAGARIPPARPAQALDCLRIAFLHAAGRAVGPAPVAAQRALARAGAGVEHAAVRARQRLAGRAVVGGAPRRRAVAGARGSVPHPAVGAVLGQAFAAGGAAPAAAARAHAAAGRAAGRRGDAPAVSARIGCRRPSPSGRSGCRAGE